MKKPKNEQCVECERLKDRAPNPLGKGKCQFKWDVWGIDKACGKFKGVQGAQSHEDHHNE